VEEGHHERNPDDGAERLRVPFTRRVGYIKACIAKIADAVTTLQWQFGRWNGRKSCALFRSLHTVSASFTSHLWGWSTTVNQHQSDTTSHDLKAALTLDARSSCAILGGRHDQIASSRRCTQRSQSGTTPRARRQFSKEANGAA